MTRTWALDMNLGHLRLVEAVPDIRRAAGCEPAPRNRRVADLALRAISGRNVRPFPRAPRLGKRGRPRRSVQVFSPCPRTPTSRASRESSGPCLLRCKRPQLCRRFAVHVAYSAASLPCRNTEHRLKSAENAFRAFFSPATSAREKKRAICTPPHCAKLRALGRQLLPVAIEEQTLMGRILADVPHLLVPRLDRYDRRLRPGPFQFAKAPPLALSINLRRRRTRQPRARAPVQMHRVLGNGLDDRNAAGRSEFVSSHLCKVIQSGENCS